MASLQLKLQVAILVLLVSNQVVGRENRQTALGPFKTTDQHGTGVELIRSLPGIAEPAQQVVLSAPLRGVLARVLVREGNMVQEEQLLAVMDNRVAAAEVRLAESVSVRSAAITEAECQLTLAKNLLARLLQVQDSNAVSELEIDQARSSRDQAEAALAQVHEQAREARISLDLALAKLESHNIRAPFAGQVLRVEGRPGQTLSDTDAVATLANLQVLKAELYIPTEWYGRLRIGAEYRLAASVPLKQPIAATLVSTEPVIDAATQTFRCVFEIDNTNEDLPSGFAVRLIRPTLPNPNPRE
jgi:RND family efflux transporter MFP subunit